MLYIVLTNQQYAINAEHQGLRINAYLSFSAKIHNNTPVVKGSA